MHISKRCRRSFHPLSAAGPPSTHPSSKEPETAKGTPRGAERPNRALNPVQLDAGFSTGMVGPAVAWGEEEGKRKTERGEGYGGE